MLLKLINTISTRITINTLGRYDTTIKKYLATSSVQKEREVKQNHRMRNETWLAFSFLHEPPHPLMHLPPPLSSRLFSSSFTIRSLLPPLTSNSTSKIHRSVCAINPNNFELESLHVEFPFTYSSLPLPALIHIFFSY